MPNRREFIHTGLAVSALTASYLHGPVALARPANPTTKPSASLFKVIYDRSFDAGRSFGAEAARRGAPVQATGSDIGSVWMNVIEPELETRPAAIAGLTAGAPLFCLELLASDYGMRLVYRIEHRPIDGDRYRHSVTGHTALSSWADELAAAGTQWSASAAGLALTHPEGLRPLTDISLLDLAEQAKGAGQPLYSWLIEPAARAVRGDARIQT